jgi:hypothetical protein
MLHQYIYAISDVNLVPISRPGTRSRILVQPVSVSGSFRAVSRFRVRGITCVTLKSCCLCCSAS